jgi:phage terminase large subunit
MEIDWKHPDYSPIWRERAERLERLRLDPSLVPSVKAHYKDNPVHFITDFGTTFDPRLIELDIEPLVPFVLFPIQIEFIGWLVARWKGREDGLVEKSRDMGVSWLSVAFAVWMWLYYEGSVIGFGSRKEAMVDEIGNPSSLFWKIRSFVNNLPLEFRPAGWNDRKHAPYMRIMNPENGATIVGEAGDNIGRGNRTGLFFKDESAHYEHADAIDAALSQTSNCKIDISTPNGAGNPFYKKRHGGKIKVFVFSWEQDPRKDNAWYQRQCETLDPVIVAQEIDRDYEASISDAFISGNLVNDAQSNGPADIEGIGYVQYGLDVARFGNDKTVLTCRQGRVVYWQKAWAKVDTEDTVGRVVAEITAFKKPDQIAVDVIGVGAGVVDKLKRIYPDIVVEVNSANRVDDGMNYNLRAKMWDNMREWLKNSPVSIPNDQSLKSDLSALRYKFKGGVRLMESKDEAKSRGIKSPDYADSLALTFAEPVKEKKRPVYIDSYQPTTQGMGY